MMFGNDPFASLGQFGSGQNPMGGMNMAGPGGFAGPMAGPMGADSSATAPAVHHHGGLHGILPYLGFGLLGGSLLGGNLGQMAPLFGLAGILGHKAKLF